MGYLGPASLGHSLYLGVSEDLRRCSQAGKKQDYCLPTLFNLRLVTLATNTQYSAYIPPFLFTTLQPPKPSKPWVGVGVMLSKAFQFSISTLSIFIPSKYCVKSAILYQIMPLSLLRSQGLFDISTCCLTQVA